MFIDQGNTFEYVAMAEPGPALQRLESGIYRTRFDQLGTLFFTPAHISTEAIVTLDTDPARRMQREIETFFDPIITQRLVDAGLKHRRAILLYGPAGTGKTSLVRRMFPLFMLHDAIILLDPDISTIVGHIIPAVRLTDVNRPIVLIIDEFHTCLANGTGRVLQLLDGLQSPEHMFFIGTTNYINRVPKPLRERPSRFSLVLEIDTLPRQARVKYAQNKYPMLTSAVIDTLVDITETLALDYLEEVCRLSLMGFSTQEIQERLHIIDTKAAVEKAEGEDDYDD